MGHLEGLVQNQRVPQYSEWMVRDYTRVEVGGQRRARLALRSVGWSHHVARAP